MRILLHMEDDSEYLCTPSHYRDQESTLLKYKRPKKLDGFMIERSKKLEVGTGEVQETGSTATPGRNSNCSSQCGIDDMPLVSNDDKESSYDVQETCDQNCNQMSPSLDSMLHADLPSEVNRQDMISKLWGWLLAWDVGVRTITVEQLQDLYNIAKNQGRHASESKAMADAHEKIQKIKVTLLERGAVSKVLEKPVKIESAQRADWQNEVDRQDKLSILRGLLAAREVGVRTITVAQLRDHYNAVMYDGGLDNACMDMKDVQERMCAIESADRINEAKRQDQLSKLQGWLAAWDVGVRTITVQQLQDFHDAAVFQGGHVVNGAQMVEARAMIQKVEVETKLREARGQYAISTLRGWLAAREIGVSTVTVTQLEELYNTVRNVTGSTVNDAAIEDARQRLDKLIKKETGA